MNMANDSVKIAVLQTDVGNIKLDVGSVKTDLKEIKNILGSNFVGRSEFDEYKKGQTYQKFLLAILVAAITGITQYVFTHN